MPKPFPSFSAEIMNSSISSWDWMCVGNVNCKLHVDAVGLHLQPTGHPCLNEMHNLFGNPSGGRDFAPVTNINTDSILKPSVRSKIKKVLHEIQ